MRAHRPQVRHEALALALAALLLGLPAAPGAANANVDADVEAETDGPAPYASPPRLPPGRVTAPQIHKRLEGLFEVVKSIPTIGMDEKEYDRYHFFPGQKIRFQYQHDIGEDDGAWAHDHAYLMTLEPPLPMAICRHERWHYLCKNNGTYLPQQPETREMALAVDELSKYERQYLPPLLKSMGPGQYTYALSFLDDTGTYLLYFHDNDTLINRTGHKLYGGPGGKVHDISVIQVLKRVK